MKLRAWQRDCVANAMNHYCTKKHFLCLATPGAGKTTMAAELASRLIQHGSIDFVLCFAPSRAVVNSLEKTFSHRLNQRFDGRVGAIGGAYTYQGMRSLDDNFWSLLESHRVLVVFDEIHHCSGNELGGSNAWGQEIMIRIQHKAAFTLALTGTPWRSDNKPIVLAEYSDSEGKIQTDYIYGLKEAIKDDVCRKPGIILIDNERLKLSNSEEGTEYEGISDLLYRSNIRYQHLLYNDSALRFCLSLGCERLNEVRLSTPNAGGLVVASSISHAMKIAHILNIEFRKSVSVVSYQHKNSGELIEVFRHGTQEWIVSVGMISEGTDIPRLQVCCHLSRITTELYFRQVLGRVLRTTNADKNNAWLYTFAEPMLVDYAERVAEEIPDEHVISFEWLLRDKKKSHIAVQPNNSCYSPLTQNCWGDDIWQYQSIEEIDQSTTALSTASITHTLECLGEFRQRVVSFFQTDLTT